MFLFQCAGEDKNSFWRIIACCCENLPEHLPRYVMGIGWPTDLVICSLLGADMFDCVYPTRTARFSTHYAYCEILIDEFLGN